MNDNPSHSHPTTGAILARCVGALSIATILNGCSQPLGLGSGTSGLTPPPTAGGTAGVGGGAAAPVRARLTPTDTNNVVTDGFRIVVVKHWDIRVDPGTCLIGGKPVAVGNPTLLTEAAPDTIPIRAERLMLSSESSRSGERGSLLQGLEIDSTAISEALDPASVRVWSASGGDRHVFRSNADYSVDSRSGRISRKTSGSIPTDSPVFVDYDVRQIRIDLIEIKPNGTVVLKNGTPSKTAPPLPEVDSGALPLARVFLDYGAASLSPDAIFSIGPPLPPVTDADRKAMVAHVSRTRTKLQANEPVTIAFWSDMVPANGAAGASTHGFPEIVEAALQAQFKGAKVSIVNASFRGSNIAVRLPKLQDEVLSHHPDLVVVGFLNDMSLPQGELRRDYTTAVQQLKAAGCEVILTTPNLTAPSSPSLRALRERDGRKDVKIIRDVAREQGVGLADVSQRWEHLSQEGIPFTALLYNGIDQPDSRGQQIYANTIAKFF